MLTHLSISNLAIVEDVQIEFKKGFNVLTGETGAGKSILIGAISLLAGKKASSDSVRQGQTQAFVEGVVQVSEKSKAIDFLESCGIACESNQIIIKRIISSNGKNKVMINHQASTVSNLVEFAKFWLNVTGQHAQQKLSDPLEQIQLLDDAGDYHELFDTYKKAFHLLRSKQKQLTTLLSQKQKAKDEKDFLEFQYKDLANANLKSGELEDLQNQYSRIKNAKEIADRFVQLKSLLSSDRGVLAQLSSVQSALGKVTALDTSFETFVEQTESAFVVLQDLADTVSKTSASMKLPKHEVDQINERVSNLQSMVKKFGSIDVAIAKRDEIKAKLDLVNDESDAQWVLEEEIEKLQKELIEASKNLNLAREKTAQTFSKSISKEVQYLGMEKAVIEILFQDWPADGSTLSVGKSVYHPMGEHQIVFVFTPNIGEGSKPLSTIASGGELSRVMLAIKSIAIQDRSSFDMTYLFDEVDAGIGGQTAERIGVRMKALANLNTQVLNVTHLAQVAAFADEHVKIQKQTQKGRTKTEVVFLSFEQRKDELARMIGGIELTQNTYAFATELLEKNSKDTSIISKGRL